MFLKEFKSTDIQQEAKRVFDAAHKEPVLIRRQTHDGYILMTKDYYERMVTAVEKAK